jgi:hypothetical protein
MGEKRRRGKGVRVERKEGREGGKEGGGKSTCTASPCAIVSVTSPGDSKPRMGGKGTEGGAAEDKTKGGTGRKDGEKGDKGTCTASPCATVSVTSPGDTSVNRMGVKRTEEKGSGG